MKKVKEGSIHGRFQPFHNEHLEYALAALNRCEFLWVGLTRPFAGRTKKGEGHRLDLRDNPLNFHERLHMVTLALISAGVPPSRFSVVPFPIDQPGTLPFFIPTNVTCFTTVNDQWNRLKIAALEESSYPTEVLWEREKGVSSSEIRDQIRRHDSSWRQEVPKSVARYLDEVGFALRIGGPGHEALSHS